MTTERARVDKGAAESTDRNIGTVLADRYEVVQLLGKGGMARVYVARHRMIDRLVAVKILRADLSGDRVALERFMNEGRAAGSLSHPNIADTTDMGLTADGAPFLVMELLAGIDLADEIASSGALPVVRCARIAMQVAAGMAAAHARGIIHRDLKSENVFLVAGRDGDHVKVLDFGISKFTTERQGNTSDLTERGVILGTPSCMAPEQISDPDRVDNRTDIYGLGAMLYHMLTAHLPFEGIPFPKVLFKITASTPTPILSLRPDAPDALVAIVERAMAREQEDRFATMTDMRAALIAFCGEGAVTPRAVQAVSAGTAQRTDQRAETLDAPLTHAGALVPSEPPTDATTLAPSSTRPLVTDDSAAVGTPPSVPAALDLHAHSGALMRASWPQWPWVFAALGVVALLLASRSFRAHGSDTKPAPPASHASIVEAPAPPVSASAVQAPEAPALKPPTKVNLIIVSEAAQATLTFRGRTSVLPFAEEVATGAAPELVEVAAPSFEGRRFWLTLDQPLRLTLRLRPGRGMLDATPEETAQALADGLANTFPEVANTPAAPLMPVEVPARSPEAPPPAPPSLESP